MYSDNKDDGWVWRYTEQENDLIYSREMDKIHYLINKFKNSLADENKIFVVKSNGNNLDDIVFALAKEFKKHGNSKILADYSRANEYSREGWQAIIDNAVKVM
ncbi:MAG: hypothetical protein E6921_15055 [Klebsiella michiganensis]|nr:hypothetical protein [Klebsiella michiganensis]